MDVGRQLPGCQPVLRVQCQNCRDRAFGYHFGLQGFRGSMVEGFGGESCSSAIDVPLSLNG